MEGPCALGGLGPSGVGLDLRGLGVSVVHINTRKGHFILAASSRKHGTARSCMRQTPRV